MNKTWDDWSDQELSAEIMGVLYGEQVKYWTLSDCGNFVYDCGPIGEDYYEVPVFDINNPADMWPLIVDNKLSIIFYGNMCEVGDGFIDLSNVEGGGYCFEGYAWENSNPLRAAAIVFLMMNDVSPEGISCQ